MNKKKKILKTILTFLLVCLISILIIAVNLKKVIIDGVIKETIKTEIVNTEHKAPNTISEEEINKITDDPKIREILNSKEIQELINKYIDITINGLLNDDDLTEVELEKDIYKYLVENKEVIEEKTNTKIDDETIEKVMEMKQTRRLSRKLIETIKEEKESITTSEKTVLIGYKTLTSLWFQLLIGLLIIINIVGIYLVNKSILKTIKELGLASIISGVFIIAMSIIVKIIVITQSILKTFHMRSLVFSGIGVLIIGIILIFIYKKKEDKNEVSKFFKKE